MFTAVSSRTLSRARRFRPAQLAVAVAALITPARLRLYPPLVPILLMSLWGVSQFLGSGLTDSMGHVIGTDFLAFYTGGWFFIEHRMDDLYDLTEQLAFQRNVVGQADYTLLDPFINPPFMAPFLSLFTRFDYLPGLFLWWTFSIILLIASISLLKMECRSLSVHSHRRLFYLLILFPPTLTCFMYGQNSAISLFLYVCFFLGLRRRRDFLAGLALGLLLYKPQLALAIGLVVLIKARWRVIAGAGCGALVWLTAGFATDPGSLAEYLEIAPGLTQMIRLNPTEFSGLNYKTWGIHSFFGFSSLLLDNLSTIAADILFVILDGAAALFLVRGWRGTAWAPGSFEWDMKMAAAFALGLLISPHLFLYDLLLLALPIAIVWNRYPQKTGGGILDGGELLGWTAMVYLISFFGSYLSLAQLKVTGSLGVPQMALQFSTIIIACWACVISRIGPKHGSWQNESSLNAMRTAQP